MMDRVGRLQLPKEALERIPFHGRVEARILNDHVELWPQERASAPIRDGQNIQAQQPADRSSTAEHTDEREWDE
jgi:hypothetical protein